MHDEFRFNNDIHDSLFSRLGISRKGIIGGMIGGIGSVVDMGIDNAQASQPYTNMPLSTLNSGQEDLTARMFGQIAPQVGQSYSNVYQGQRYAGPSALQQQGFGMAAQTPQMSQPFYNNALDIMNNVSQSPQQQFQPAMDAAFNTWEQRIAPDIMNRFASTGSADSGMAQQTMGRAGADLSTQLAGQLAGVQQQGISNQISSLMPMSQYANMPMDQAGQIAALGSMQRGIGQDYLTGQQQQFMEADPARNPWLSYGMQMLPTSGNYMENAVVQQPISQGDALTDFLDPFGFTTGWSL
jgi:hypothetical protein